MTAIINRFKLSIFFSLLLYSLLICANETSSDFNGVWAGIEIMGLDRDSSKHVKSLIPIKIGDHFKVSDSNKYRNICGVIRKKFPERKINCSFIGYPEKKFYFNVEFSPIKNDRDRNSFRYIAEKSTVSPLSKELISFYEQWSSRYWHLVSNGNFPKESFEQGFLDFDDPELHALAIKLTKAAHKENSKLLEIIYFSDNSAQRRMAANLLSWSRHPENLAFVLKWDLLNDPNSAVRNDLSRSISLYLTKINNETLLRKAIPAFCKQAALPSHTDRNKALVSILEILRKNPKVSLDIHHECRETISYISEASILENSGGIAKQIEKIVESANG